jgi:hypothetical protein
MTRIYKYSEAVIAVFLLYAVNVWSDDPIAHESDSTSTPESAPILPVNSENEPLSLETHQLQAELDSVRAALEQMSRELRMLQGEINSVKASIDSNTVKPYNKVTLKAGLSGEYFGILAMAAVNTKISFNRRNKAASRYIGADLAGGYLGLYAGGNFGVEKHFPFNSGLSLTQSFGAHIGVFGYSNTNLLAGVHTISEFSFSSKRFQPYLSAGIRLNGVSGMGLIGGFMSFPLGAGMSFKI